MIQIKGFKNYKITKDGKVYSLVSKKYLKPSIGTTGYYFLNLYKNKKPYNKQIHQLMAINYLNHKPNGQTKVVDHIDNNKLNNKIENLQIITQRQNSLKDNHKSKSGFKGVYWNKLNKKWQVRPRINGRKYLLGYYDNPKTASIQYLKFTNYIDNINVRKLSIPEIKEMIKEYKQKIKNLKQ